MENTSHATEHPRIDSIEMALDALVTAQPKAGEKTHSFVHRCCTVVTGQRQREQLFNAIMRSLNELGLKAVDPATAVQAVLNGINERAAAAQEGGAA